MKKIFALILAAVLLLALTACGEVVDGPGMENTAAAPETEQTGMANPWTDVETPEAAAEGAEVGYFMVPDEGGETPIGPVNWTGFRWMKGVAEVNGFIGVPELTVRKGLKQDTHDVSGDYTEYAKEWTAEIDGWEVNCFGNEEGRATKAIWLSDNFSYSIVVRGQGSEAETFGLDSDTLTLLVTAIQ